MFERVAIGVSDGAASRAFYAAAGKPAALELLEGVPVTRRLHVAFGAADRAAVDAWWRRLVDAGYESDGRPGPRPEYSPSYYGAFVLDPDGNSVEAVHHDTSRPGRIDHLWLRSADVAAAKRFYEGIAPLTGVRLVHDTADRVRFTDGEGSFSFVAGDEPTRHVGLVFRIQDEGALPPAHDPDGNSVAGVVR